MDFSIAPELRELQGKVRRFVDTVVIPYESNVPHDVARWHEMRQEMQAKAKAAGIFAPQLSPEWGGLGLNWRECSLLFEEAGRSILGPQALNCAAPDEGNMHLLEAVASPEQKQKYLKPLAAGEVRSCFSMTEPARHETSMAKVFVSETVGRVMDRAVQVMGALGISEDTPSPRCTVICGPSAFMMAPQRYTGTALPADYCEGRQRRLRVRKKFKRSRLVL